MKKHILLFLATILSINATTTDKDIITPYFDAEYYRTQYADQLQGGDPLDHFLSIDFKGNWEKHTDPNPWFNTTLYLRCFPCTQNPFVDFLNQPSLGVDASTQVMDVYTKPDQLTRAWLATEALLRLNQYNVILHVLPEQDESQLQGFKPQEKRGLKLLKDNSDHKSFYKSAFLFKEREEDRYPYPSEKDKNHFRFNRYIAEYIKGRYLLQHKVNFYTGWSTKGLLDPLYINFLESNREPLFYKISGINDLESYFLRINSGCDIISFFSSFSKKSFIIPGATGLWIDTKELNSLKEFSISYLLSLAQQGNIALHRENFNYHLRPIIWNQEKELKQPTRFYVSRRAIAKYPQEYQDRVLPTDSKKWVFDSQFNIAMENCRQVNYMTEKLFGCFVSLTVPIYLGCPNVRDWFDERGMFIAESVDEIISICQSITPKTYAQMLPYLQENKRRTEELMKLQGRYIKEFFDDIDSGKI